MIEQEKCILNNVSLILQGNAMSLYIHTTTKLFSYTVQLPVICNPLDLRGSPPYIGSNTVFFKTKQCPKFINNS